jgi:biopolymer transport protein ExbB
MPLNTSLRAQLAAVILASCAFGASSMLPAMAQGNTGAPPAPAAADPQAPAPAPADAAPATEPGTQAAPAPMAPPEPMPIDVPETEIENPYGLEAVWRQGDMVAKITLLIMLIMSLGTWYILFTKLYEQHKLMRSADAATRSFWSAGTVAAGAGALEAGSAFRYIAESGLKASEHHEGTLVEQIDLHTWVTMSIQRAVDHVNSRMQEGLAFLATVGSTAPFVGLFGTVWGIYHALTAIGVSGQASIDKVAGPVGEALIMTAIGLAVAVPAVMGYNWLIRRNKVAMDKVRAFGGDLHNVLLAGKRA